ncbi:hypothetical protein FB565_005729 [Actinoplanes lutulentus]|uniref:Uncharacterized protein n=1 Tax=Actinoplanes lutulentus TaxID=1287878 RepID=A0A327ZDM2_9ACTN|nr:hypothetical protein [Actinoplanes lutulentus]MBB2945971.1 hypothetical protein [Actinoplanes lutulentus]RAK38019.1 hypothetical protein B0I29_106289 [Actinoplanes lutulentus]
MTGDAPQPGETPRDQANPWTLAEPEPGWRRGEHDREPQDLAEGSRFATAGELMIIEPDGREPAPGVPKDVDLDLEEADRNRPTVVINPQRPLPDVPVSPEVEARLERLENSPFWMNEAERAAIDASRPAHVRPPAPRRTAAHNPVGPLVALVMLSLLAAFFGWVSAEPFWLATGHGDDGWATTSQCSGDGLTQRCSGQFTTEDGAFTASRVTLLGISGESRTTGAITPARMVSPGSDQAYAGPAGTLMHLRWALGFILVLICGYGIAQTTGANRLESGMKRRRAVLLSVMAPVLLQLGFLVAAF